MVVESRVGYRIHEGASGQGRGNGVMCQRSVEGWAEGLDKLAAMQTGACHQYLDGPLDNVQIMASIAGSPERAKLGVVHAA